ncbi:uncharacterized protein G2W53_026748 [Senna tora]|uniref:Uncharacterized protein n=1 Tax=Senna tora TaxID=362788 RepID=A0A834TFK4_9FABA|nr:uncharacterized protein G2W53_026748 [Senna tora]
MMNGKKKKGLEVMLERELGWREAPKQSNQKLGGKFMCGVQQTERGKIGKSGRLGPRN